MWLFNHLQHFYKFTYASGNNMKTIQISTLSSAVSSLNLPPSDPKSQHIPSVNKYPVLGRHFYPADSDTAGNGRHILSHVILGIR